MLIIVFRFIGLNIFFVYFIYNSFFDNIYFPKFGTRVVNNSINTSYIIDHSSGNDFKLTMTGDTSFTESNLPNGSNTTELTIKLTGDFVPTFPSYWDIVGDDYFSYQTKMLLLEHKRPKRDTNNLNSNKKETFIYKTTKTGYEYHSSIKMITAPQLEGKITRSKNKAIIERYDYYEGLNLTDTVKYIRTPARKKEIKVIEKLISRYCEDYN